MVSKVRVVARGSHELVVRVRGESSSFVEEATRRLGEFRCASLRHDEFVFWLV